MDNFRSRIYAWYKVNMRDLPWRATLDPYKIWLSEIILQQTRIDQGIAYYFRFTEAFPTVFDLAKASEDDVLKLWQGLGYYSRARNLHYSAIQIVRSFNGKFPETYSEILKLKGVGDYTAAAVASIAFGQAHPAIDGNVFRVLSRYYGIDLPIDSNEGKKAFRQIADELIQGTDPGMHNQAMMEFGALQCVPSNPSCDECPLNDSCFALASGKIGLLPVKKGKTQQRDRYFNYMVIDDGTHIYLRKRIAKDVWRNLFEFPMIETSTKTDEDDVLSVFIQGNELETEFFTLHVVSEWKTHLLSHQRIHYRFFKLQLSSPGEISQLGIRVNKKDIFTFAVHKLVETYIESELVL